MAASPSDADGAGVDSEVLVAVVEDSEVGVEVAG